MTAPNFDCDHTDEPVCPHCGEEEGDAWEYNLGDGDEKVTTCCSCGQMFVITARINVTYSTEPTTEREQEIIAAKQQIQRSEMNIRILSRDTPSDLVLAPHREQIADAQALIAKLESEAS